MTPGAPADLSWSTVVGNRVNCTGQCWSFVSVPLGRATATPDGSLRAPITIPDGLGGWHVVQVSQGGVVKAQLPYYVKRSFVSMPKTVKAGKPFVIDLKGVGWTQLDNTVAVTYDNSYIGYACGFNSNGDVQIQMIATGAPGTHLIDLYPLLYTQQPAYPYPQLGMVPLLGFAMDAPGLAAGYQLPAFRLAIKVVAWRYDGGALSAPHRSPRARRGATRRRRATQPGSHQLYPRSTAINAGTRTHRTSVASRMTPSASARPSCLRPVTEPARKPQNAAAMISAADVTIRPVRSRPVATAYALSPGLVPGLAHAGDDEDLVVHREPEEDGEEEDRDPALDLSDGPTPSASAVAPHRQAATSSPYTAAVVSRFRSTACSGSTSDRNARTRMRYVSASDASTSHGKAP